MQLNRFNKGAFTRGASYFKEGIWLILQGLFFSSWIPGAGWRCGMLRMFGAKIGKGVNIKPRVHVKFPWRLRIGDNCWIGERVWIDNLDQVTIGNNVCISQSVYLCTGSHDYKKESFDLVTKPIWIEDEVWICASARIAPGVTVRKGSLIGLGAVLTKTTKENGIYQGNPAQYVRDKGTKDTGSYD